MIPALLGNGLVVSTIFHLIFIVPETLIIPINAYKIRVFAEPCISSNTSVDRSDTRIIKLFSNFLFFISFETLLNSINLYNCAHFKLNHFFLLWKR